MGFDALDLFAGPGGWDIAARRLGLSVLGLEFDAAACATRRAAGLATVEGDVTVYRHLVGLSRGLIASPPCQTFSVAGGSSGYRALGDVISGIKAMVRGEPLPVWEDARTGLVLEPLRWILDAHWAGLPFRWIALEQVPPVLPIWRAIAVVLRALGYSVAVGNVQAEQYGVPQTRRRAILLASLDREVILPPPTHSRYHNKTPGRLDEGVLPWVSMAQALGWGVTVRPSPTVTGGGTSSGGAEPFGNGARQGLMASQGNGDWVLRSNYNNGNTNQRGIRAASQPAPTLTGRAGHNMWLVASNQVNSAVRHIDQPAPTLTSDKGFNNRRWFHERPATTVQGDPRIGQPGHKCMTADCHPGRGTTAQFNAESVRVSIEEAAILQTFPVDYPWQGSKGKQYQQIGNAIPPLLALHLLSAVTGVAYVAPDWVG